MESLIGKGCRRIDAYDKVTGRGLYASDYDNQFTHVAQIKALRSPYAHALIKKLDISRAQALDGVIYVMTGYEKGIDWDQFPKAAVLAMDRALWAGQTVALVCAETEEIAEKAVDLIDVEYEVLPHVLDYYDAIKPNPAAVVDPDYETRDQGFMDRPADRATNRVSPNIVGAYFMNEGNVEEAMKTADRIAEGEFWVGKKTASPMECANALCRYDNDGGITMWSNGAGVHGVIKQGIVRILGMEESHVRVIQPYMGGSFGSRLNPFIELLTALMCIRTKRTVRYKFTRKELFIASPSNWTCITKVKLGAKNDGTIVANDYYLCEEIGAALNNTFFSGRLSSSGAAPVYTWGHNIRMDTYAVTTNTVPAAEYRGLGCPEAEFGIECLINQLADELHMSPVEIRKKNMIKRGERDCYGELITSTGIEKCMEAVADAIKVEEEPVQDMGVWKKGRGIAVAGKQNTPLGRSEAEVWFNSDGTIELFISCDENGMGATTAMTQIVANEFKVPIEAVKTTKGDTAITPYDNYSASSRTTYNCGNACMLAAQDCIRQLKDEVARAYGLHPSKVEIEGTKAILKGSYVQEVDIPSLFVPVGMFTQGNWGLQKGSPVKGHAVYCPAAIHQWGKDGRADRVWNWFQYSACAVEAAVNEETGQIRILKIASSADTGNPINTETIRGQIIGGIHMAVGFATMEEHLYDDKGQMWNCNLSDYRLPLSDTLPTNDNVFTFICPDPLPDGPYGAKGMAESITIPVGPAIAEAVYKAVGVRVTGYPMTAERILKLIEDRDAVSEGGAR